MSFLFGGQKSQAGQAPAVSGLQVQTAAYGKVIPIAAGTIRLSPNMIWYGDFQAIKHAISGGKGGVAGGGGGKGGGGGYSYTYSASCMFGLCEGPIQNVLAVYKDKAVVTPAFLGMTTALGTYPQAPWSYLTANHGYVTYAAPIPGTPYQLQVPYHNPFLADNGVTTNITLAQLASGVPGVNQYTVQIVNSTSIYTFNSARAGASVTFTITNETTVATVPASTPYTITIQNRIAAKKVQLLNFTFAKVASAPAVGQYSVSSSGVYTFNAADTAENVSISYYAGDQRPSFEAIGYNGIAWAAAANYDLGNSPSLSNHNFVVEAFGAAQIGKISPPAAPTLTSVASGALAATTYYVETTWVTANGETTASAESSLAVIANHLVKVTAPGSAPANATGWNVYITNTENGGSGNEALQNSAPLTIGVDYQLPTTGVTFGVTTTYLSQSISADGSILNFTDSYATNPVVTPKNFSAGVTSGKATNISVTGCTITLFNGTTQVAGTCDIDVKNSNGTFPPSFNSTGLPDADPSAWITEFLTNANYGCFYPSGKIGDLTTYQAYTVASGLLISFVLDSQSSAASILQELATITNSEWINGGLGSLTLVPYGDQTVTGNGYTYLPPLGPLFDLTDDDFVTETADEDPVERDIKDPLDVQSWYRMEFRNREHDYNPDIAETKLQYWIDLYKTRPSPQSGNTLHLMADPTAANLSVQLQIKRELVMNTFRFRLDQRYIVLDPMDIVTITDTKLGLNKYPVRIKEISEDSNGNLEISAEDYLAGLGSSPAYSFQAPGGFSADYNENPGNVNTPIIFEAPVQIATNTGLETWILCSGGPIWGGAQIYASSDGLSYNLIGRSVGQGRQGVVVSDSGTTIRVDLTETQAQLLSGTPTDATQGNTLCYVDGELFSYTTATLVAPFIYDLTGLVRGQYGTTEVSAVAGDVFGRLDQQVVEIPYDKTQIGQQIYIKFLSFNLYQGGLQGLSEVQPYIHTVVGPPIPPDVSVFIAQQTAEAVTFSWLDVNDFAVRGYNISYGPQDGPGSGYENSVLLTFASRATEVTTAQVPPGCWTFYIVAIDIAGQVSANPSTQDLCITNTNSVLNDFNAAPTWPTQDNQIFEFYKTFDGKLVPNGTKTCDQYVPVAAPAAPVLYQVAGSTLLARTYFVKITYYTTGGDETTASTESSLIISPNNLLAVTAPPASGNATHYNVYAGTTSGSETLQNASPVILGQDWEEPNGGLISGVSPPTQNTTGWEVFDDFVPDVAALSYYITPTVDLGKSGTVRAWVILSWALGPGQTTFPATMNDFPAFLFYSTATPGLLPPIPPVNTTSYTVTFVTGRYFASQFEFLFTDGGVPYFNNIEVVLDSTVEVFNVNGVASVAAGSTITFASLGLSFFSAPNVVANPSVGGITSSVATSITATSFVLTCYNGSTPADGTSNLIISGVGQGV